MRNKKQLRFISILLCIVLLFTTIPITNIYNEEIHAAVHDPILGPHEDSCYPGTKHSHTGNEISGGGCYGTSYLKDCGTYVANQTTCGTCNGTGTAKVKCTGTVTSTHKDICDGCNGTGKSKYDETKVCTNCGANTDQEDGKYVVPHYQCSNGCGTGWGGCEVGRDYIGFWSKTHYTTGTCTTCSGTGKVGGSGYSCNSCGASSSSAGTHKVTRYSLNCGKTPGCYYDDNGNEVGPTLCPYAKHTVTYNATANGGALKNSGDATKEVYYNKSVDLTVKAEKEGGWTHIGWNKISTATSGLGSLTMGTSDITLYAIYEKTITLTQYDATGKFNTESHTIYNTTTSADFTIKSASTYSGWTHYGWSSSTSNEATSAHENGSISLSNSLTIYALYERNISLSYIKTSIITPEDGVLMSPGTTVTAPVTVPDTVIYRQTTNSYDIDNWSSKNCTVGSPGDWTGFTFLYWGVNGHYNTTTKTVGSSYKLLNSTVMHPIWQRNQYTITYDYWTNGGDSVSVESAVFYYEYEVDLTPVAIKTGDTGTYSSSNKDGWEFIGWNEDPNATEGMDTYKMPAENKTLYAIYRKEMKLSLVDIVNTTKTLKTHTYVVYNNTTSVEHTLPNLSKCTYKSTSGSWYSEGWTYEQTPYTTKDYSEGDTFIVWESDTLYGLYNRNLIHTFVSYDGTAKTNKTVSGVQKINAYKMSTFNSPDITAPTANLYTGDPNNGTWTFRGWTNISNNSNPDTVVKAGATINHDSIQTYYAIYDRDLTITYYDHLGTTYTETVHTAPQSTSAYSISKYNYSTLTVKDINAYTGWNGTHWSNSSTGLENFLSEGASYKVTNNTILYAVYNRDLTVTYVIAEENPIKDTKTQYANATNINGTKTSVTFTTIKADTYTDSRDYNWYSYYWTSDYTRKTEEVDVGLLEEISIKDSLTLYSVYRTTYTGTFKSIRGSQEAKEIISGYAYMNADNTSSINNPVIKTPYLYSSTLENKSWSVLGWTLGTKTNSSVVADENQDYTLTEDATFYGLYSAGVPVTFIDYNDTTQRERTINVGQTLNTYNKTISQDSCKTPAVGIYTDANGIDWEILGWASSTDPAATVDFETDDEFILGTNFVYYAVYRKPVKLTFVDYNKTVKTENTVTNYAYTNSKDVLNVQEASFVLPTIKNCTINNKDWTAKGWSASSNSLSSLLTISSTITSKEDQKLYAIYETTINVIYNNNGGSTNIANSTGNKTISASGYESNPSIFITNTTPSRTGYKFQTLWRANTNSGAEYESGKAYTFEEDIIIYAQWGVETTDKTVKISFDDNNNALSSRPETVTLVLKRDGEKVTNYIVSTIDSTVCYPQVNRTVPSDGIKINVQQKTTSFNFTFEQLQKYSPSDGHEYLYTVEQVDFTSINPDVEYTTTYENDTFDIINTLVNSNAKKIVGTITWDDDGNTWFLRPNKITITLLKTDPDTNETTSLTKTYQVDKSAVSFGFDFSNLEAVNVNGNLYKYTVVVPRIINYTIYPTSGSIDASTTDSCDFVYKLSGMPGPFTGINKLIISADAFDIDGNVADRHDYFNIAATEDNVILITLKEVAKTWDGTDKNANEIYDINTYTGNEYNVIVTPNTDTIIDYMYDGKFEIVMSNNAIFNFDKFSAMNSDIYNAEFVYEDGRYFIIYSSRDEYGAIFNLHTEIILESWRGVTSMQELYKEKDWTIIN